MTEAVSPGQITPYEQDALRLAGDRSLSGIRDDGAYILECGLDLEKDIYSQCWDVAIYLIDKKIQDNEIISKLARLNKKLVDNQRLDAETLKDIKRMAYAYFDALDKIEALSDDNERSSDEITQKALEIINNQEVMNQFLKTFKTLHAGDEEAAKVMMLISVTGSSLTSEGIHMFLTGPKGSGKSTAIRAFLHLWPPEYVVSGEFSPRALYYNNNLKPGCAIWPDDWYSTPEVESHIRRIMSEFQQETQYQTVGKGEGGTNQGITITIPPRVSFFFSNTSDTGSDELADRQYRLSIVPDDASDKAFWEFLKDRIKTGREPSPDTEDVKICREILRYYKNKRFKVIVPFADRIEFRSLKVRRDISMFISFLDACAVLNHAKRACTEESDDEGPITIVEADEEDFHQALLLFEASANDGGREHKLSKEEMNLLIWLSEKMNQYPNGIPERIIHAEYLSGETEKHRKPSRSTLRRILYGKDGVGGIINKVPGCDIGKENEMDLEQEEIKDYGGYRTVTKRGKSQNIVIVPSNITSQSNLSGFVFATLKEANS